MKKLLALLVAGLMLLSAFGLAEEAPGKQLIVKDVKVDLGGGQVLDLSGLELVLAAAANDAQIGLRAALEGAGASILNAIMTIDESQLAFHVDGLSDVYAISMEDLESMMEMDVTDEGAAFAGGFDAGYNVGSNLSDEDMEAMMALFERAGEIFEGSVTPAGTETIESVEYQVSEIAISEDQTAELLDGMVEIFDHYPQYLEGSGYDSFRALFDDVDLRMSVDGKVYEADAEKIWEIYLNLQAADMEAPERAKLYIQTSEKEVGPETSGTDFYASISAMEGDTAAEVGAISGTLTEVSDEFGAFELYFYTPETQDKGLYVNVYAPSTQGNGLWQVSLGSADPSEQVSFDFICGKADGQDQMYFQVAENGTMFYVSYAGANGLGTIEAAMMQGDATLGGVSANVEVLDDDGSWVPGSVGQTVDIMTIDEAQSQKVATEAQALLLNAMYGISQANPDLGMLISNMMTGTTN